MSLANLIHTKNGDLKLATATVATLATVQPDKPGSVATVASVAVATSKTEKTDIGAEAELRALIGSVTRHEGWTDADTAEAIAAALADPQAALEHWRLEAAVLAQPAKAPDWSDDRRTCTLCANLRGARCAAAARGELVGIVRSYNPCLDISRRCEGFAPLANDAD